MDTPTAPKHWKTVLREQGRDIAWLADKTEKPRATVYGYSRGDRRPTAEWLEAASRVLGEEVAA
jgi:hypothetical protein